MKNSLEKKVRQLEQEILECEQKLELTNRNIRDARWGQEKAKDDYDEAAVTQNNDAMKKHGSRIEVEENELTRLRKRKEDLTAKMTDLRERYKEAVSELEARDGNVLEKFNRLSVDWSLDNQGKALCVYIDWTDHAG